MEIFQIILTLVNVFLVCLILFLIIVSYNLYQKSEQQRREITTLAQEIAFIQKKLEELKK